MPLESTSPKTTQPPANSQRPKQANKSTAEKIRKTLDAFPDKIDVRDWFYHPNLRPLPEQVINFDCIPMVLDQGEEGACTGFALAAVINYHLVRNERCTRQSIDKECVSPRMLYEMARRYDEWPGEEYVGSSARGSMKGWTAHGVVKRWQWDDAMTGPTHLDEERARAALEVPAGAYYRVMHRNIRDMHAAISEAGILFATLMVHEGWVNPQKKGKMYEYVAAGKKKKIQLPIIERKDRADGGHAIAIVGYTREGFIIQNSWGTDWGYKGFAVLPYEDWMLHSSDCWVVQLGVPVDTNLWDDKTSRDTDAGKQRAADIVPLESIRPYVVNIGNNGFLSDSGSYWTTPTDIERMFASIHETSLQWDKKRILLYLHGGLNSEKEVARRIISFKQVCLDNNIYPVHIMWETDFWTSLKNNLLDVFTNDDRASADWLSKLRDATLEIKDRTFELTASRPGTMLWDEMKENAQLASKKTVFEGDKKRAIITLAEKGCSAWSGLDSKDKSKWEIHIVAHSAGSIFLTYALETLLEIGIPVKSVQFLAPAISTELFKSKYLPLVEKDDNLRPTIYALSDKGERDDDVGPYGKSLLYLVSNAFERRRETPILGMEKFINGGNRLLNKSQVDPEISRMLKKDINGMPALVIAGEAAATAGDGPNVCRAETHGGFDNDPFTLNAVLWRILGKKPKRKFDPRDLQY
ncbi:MAG: C1 family peptidase [Bacteroidota bacterium]